MPMAAIDAWWRSVRRAVADPRLSGVAGALPRTAVFMASRWHGDAVAGRSVGLAAQVLLDEVLISAMRNPKLFPKGQDYERAGEDIRAAYRMWESMGWLDDPAAYHVAPEVPADAALVGESGFGQRYEHLTFTSGYRPHEGEPGRDRWLSHVPNRTAHAYLLRHGSPGRPWLVCFHGFGMGKPMTDLRAFRAERLHRQLGLNVLTLVLPMHGPRQHPGADRGEGFMTIDLVDSLHGLTQAAYDARSAIRWIRHTAGEVPVGVYGVSLGGYVAALTASVEDGLACAIAGIPATDLPDLYRRHSTPYVRRRAFAAGALGDRADAVHRVVSPLVLPPKVSWERRYIFAGAGDRMSTSGQAKRLWEHWERPNIMWYPGGHIGFFMAGSVQDFVTSALIDSGLALPGLRSADATISEAAG